MSKVLKGIPIFEKSPIGGCKITLDPILSTRAHYRIQVCKGSSRGFRALGGLGFSVQGVKGLERSGFRILRLMAFLLNVRPQAP